MATGNTSIFTLVNIGWALIIISVIAVGIFFYRDGQLTKWIDQYSELSGEIELRAAMNKDPEIYLLKDMVVTGEPCNDNLRILATPYIYISYHKLEYNKFHTNKRYQEDWRLVSDWERKSRQLIFFNDIYVEADDYTAYCKYINLSENVLPEYVDKVQDPQSSKYVYYPDQPGDFIGNVKYEISGIPLNSKLACIAEVGAGKVRLISYDKNNPPVIAGDNDMSSLTYSLDETGSAFAAMGVFSFIFGVVILIFGYVSKLFSHN